MDAILLIGGSDCSSGAGVQRDLKVLQEKNIYGVTVVTAITAQNSEKFYSYQLVSQRILKDQLKAVFDEFHIRFVKIGMLAHSKIVTLISRFLVKKNVKIVYDPVMQSTTGGGMTDNHFIDTLKNELFPVVELLTPNKMELEKILGFSLNSCEENFLKKIYNEVGVKNLLIKGGHWEGDKSIDYLLTNSQVISFEKIRIKKEVRGTGCSLASSIVAELYKGNDIVTAIRESKEWLWKKINISGYKNFL